MKRHALALLVAAVALQAAAAMTVSQISAQLRDSSRCGCAVCPCVSAQPVRTIEGLEKLAEAKARAALPLGWRPTVQTEECPCPHPAPCREDPCEPAPCPCRKPEFYFANLVNELGADECQCPKPKPCTAFPCEPTPPCPCKRTKTVEPELGHPKPLVGVVCVGPGPCITPRHFHEPEYTKKLQTESVVRRVVKKLPGGVEAPGAAPSVTDSEASGDYAPSSSSGGLPPLPTQPVNTGDASSSSGGGDDSGDRFFSDPELDAEEKAAVAAKAGADAAAAGKGGAASSSSGGDDGDDESSSGTASGGTPSGNPDPSVSSE